MGEWYCCVVIISVQYADLLLCNPVMRDLYLDFDVLDLPDSIIDRYFYDAVRGTFTDSFVGVERSEACNGKGHCSPHLSRFKLGL